MVGEEVELGDASYVLLFLRDAIVFVGSLWAIVGGSDDRPIYSGAGR